MLGAMPGHRRHFCLSHWLFVKLYSLKLVKVGKSSFSRRDASDISSTVDVLKI